MSASEAGEGEGGDDSPMGACECAALPDERKYPSPLRPARVHPGVDTNDVQIGRGDGYLADAVRLIIR